MKIGTLTKAEEGSMANQIFKSKLARIKSNVLRKPELRKKLRMGKTFFGIALYLRLHMSILIRGFDKLQRN